MDITINDVLYVVLTICVPFLVAQLSAFIKAKTAGTLYEDAMSAIVDAVASVQQTYVQALKEAGTFDAAAQEVARKRAVEIALSTMSEAAIKYLNKVCGSAEDFIMSKLEAAVLEQKGGVAK